MTYPYVRIVDPDHPHYPEVGKMTGETITFSGGGKMMKIRLMSCRHGADACFVTSDQVREIPEPGEEGT